MWVRMMGRRAGDEADEMRGAIVSRARFRGGPIASEERLVASLRAARQNKRIRGVILHIDSPGGRSFREMHNLWGVPLTQQGRRGLTVPGRQHALPARGLLGHAPETTFTARSSDRTERLSSL